MWRVCMWYGLYVEVKDNLREPFPSIMWVWGIKIRSWDLKASAIIMMPSKQVKFSFLTTYFFIGVKHIHLPSWSFKSKQISSNYHIFRKVQVSPLSNFRIFLAPQKEPPTTLSISSTSPPLQSQAATGLLPTTVLDPILDVVWSHKIWPLRLSLSLRISFVRSTYNVECTGNFWLLSDKPSLN